MSDSLNFSASAYEQGNVPTNLERVEMDIMGAISNAVDNGGFSGSQFIGNDNDSVSDEIMLSKLGSSGPGGVAGGIFLTAYQENASGKNDIFSGGKNKKQSIFMGDYSKKQTNSMGMTKTYSEKKQELKVAKKQSGKGPKMDGSSGKISLVEKTKLTGASLTGESECHSKNFLVKGANIPPDVAARLGLIPQALVNKLEDVRDLKNKPPSLANLIDGLGNGHTSAENWMKNNHDSTVVRNLINDGKIPAPSMN